MRKSKLFIILLLLATSFKMVAQDEEGPGGSQVESLRVGIYTRVMHLNADEAAKFWPLYNEMQSEIQKQKTIQKGIRQKVRENYFTISDEELSKCIDDAFDCDQKILDAKRKYFKEFAKAIPLKKVALIPKADREFQQEILKRMGQMRDGGGGQ